MSEIDWNSVKGKLAPAPTFFRFYQGMYEIRPVGPAIEFDRFFLPHDFSPRTICVDKSITDEIVTSAQKISIHLAPNRRYAINAIDMSNDQLKVLEGGKSIFSPLATWSVSTNRDPGGFEAPVWQILVAGEGIARRYSMAQLGYKHLPSKYILHFAHPEVSSSIDFSTLYDLKSSCKIISSIKMANKILFDKEPSNYKYSNLGDFCPNYKYSNLGVNTSSNNSDKHDYDGIIDEINALNENPDDIIPQCSRFTGFMDDIDECEI
jgi:hypothetical protein